jgi:uncharacterized protein (DUF4415 family)
MMMAETNPETPVEEIVETPETPVETEGEETPVETETSETEGEESQEQDEKEEEPKSKRGRPKKEKWDEKTTLEYDEDIHEDYHVNEEYQSKLVEFAKENGIEPSTTKELLNLQARLSQQFDEDQTKLEEKEMQETQESLKKEWGSEYEGTMKAIQKLVTERADENVASLLFNTSFGSNQAVIKMLGSIAKDLNETGDLVTGKSASQKGYVDVNKELQNEYSKDPVFKTALSDPSHAQYKKYVDRYNEITMRHTEMKPNL